MENKKINHNIVDSTKTAEQVISRKKYAAPLLTTYGDIEELTQATKNVTGGDASYGSTSGLAPVRRLPTLK